MKTKIKKESSQFAIFPDAVFSAQFCHHKSLIFEHYCNYTSCGGNGQLCVMCMHDMSPRWPTGRVLGGTTYGCVN